MSAYVFTVRFRDPQLGEIAIPASRYEVDEHAHFARFVNDQGRELSAIVFSLILSIETRGYAGTSAPETGARGPLATPSGADLAIGKAADAGHMRPAPIPPTRLPLEAEAAAHSQSPRGA